jgi:predicted nuclease with TOPRIM domain
MSDVKELTGSIRNKLGKMIYALHSLQDENNTLRQKQADLLQTIENQNSQIKELRDNYGRSLIADSIKQTEGSREVKKQLDEMVREIDRCIELLNK